jgi:hypothetical protein
MSVAENEKIWVVFFGGNVYGPVSAMEIKYGLLDNKIKADDGLWKKGWNVWKRVQDIPLFAYQCSKSPGRDEPAPELPIPSAEDFQSVLTPQLSSKDVSTTVNWSKKRLAIIGASYVIAGPVVAVAATVLTRQGSAKREAIQTKDASYINDRNQ